MLAADAGYMLGAGLTVRSPNRAGSKLEPARLLSLTKPNRGRPLNGTSSAS